MLITLLFQFLFAADVLIKNVNCDVSKNPILCEPIAQPPNQDSLGIGFNAPDLYFNLVGFFDQTKESFDTRYLMGKRQIQDAYYMGAKHLVLLLPGYFPHQPSDNGTQRNNILLWQTNPQEYWKKMDFVFSEIEKFKIKIVVRQWEDLSNFTVLTNENYRDFITNENSKSYQLHKKYWTEFMSKFKNRIAAYGIKNELNLGADLDLEARCAADVSSPCRTLINSYQKTKQMFDACNADMKTQNFITSYKNYCSATRNYSTNDMIIYLKNELKLFKEIASGIPLTNAMGLIRGSAEHLRARPEWVTLNPVYQPYWGYDNPDWTADTKEQFIKNIKDISTGFDYVDLHIYQDVQPIFKNALDLKATVRSLGFKFYYGELLDQLRSESAYTFPWTIEQIKNLEPDSALSIWALEFYQFNNYDFQNNSPSPVDIMNPKTAQLISAIKEKNQWKNDIATNSFCFFSNPAVPIGANVSKQEPLFVMVSTDALIQKIEIFMDNLATPSKTLTDYPYKINIGSFGSGKHSFRAKVYDTKRSYDCINQITVTIQ